MWSVVLLEEVEEWFLGLDESSAASVAATIDALEQRGPQLSRPLADRIKYSNIHNMKELRPTNSIRILFVFDPNRQAVLLVAGDKAGKWSAWYKQSVPLAESRYENWLLQEGN